MRQLSLINTTSVVLLDDEDYARFSVWKWEESFTGYVNRKEGKHRILLHREIMKAPKGFDVTFRDDNKKNVQKDNLLICTRQQTAQTREKRSDNVGKYKGVIARKFSWSTRIKVDGKYLSFGNFFSEDDAGIEYNYAARKYYGEFATFNDIPFWDHRLPLPMTVGGNRAHPSYGIRYDKALGAWKLRKLVRGKLLFVGDNFKTLEEAVAFKLHYETLPEEEDPKDKRGWSIVIKGHP